MPKKAFGWGSLGVAFARFRDDRLPTRRDIQPYVPPVRIRRMDGKRALAATLLCAGVAFVGVFHLVFSTVFGYGFRTVSVGLIAAAVFGILVVNA